MLLVNSKVLFIKWLMPSLVVTTIFLLMTNSVYAQTSPSVLYVPIIGLSSVPNPLALPKGPGKVVYNYAVKNFLEEVALSQIKVTDDNCESIEYSNGDDNRNSLLEYQETWRYTCVTTLSQTTQSTATVTGFANNLTATHKAYANVVVGSDKTPPIVNIINVTKVSYPLSLPIDGGEITYTYKVNNPGVVPLSGVVVTDNKCTAMSGRLGDTNGNNLLDINEVWIYTCTTQLKETTTNTVTVNAFANGLKATGEATLTVQVDIPKSKNPFLPNVGTTPNIKMTIWEALLGLLSILIIFFFLSKGKPKRKIRGRKK